LALSSACTSDTFTLSEDLAKAQQERHVRIDRKAAPYTLAVTNSRGCMSNAKTCTVDAVSVRPHQSASLQRACTCGNHAVSGECEECRHKREGQGGPLQRLPTHGGPEVSAGESRKRGNSGKGAVPPIVHDVLRSPGQPLDAATRAFMEPRFGHDFSNVRVHTDTRAAESARAVSALAYTVGRSVVFGVGQYAPQTHVGQQLMAHELMHVLQQGSVSSAPHHLLLDSPNSACEHEAVSASASMTRFGGVSPTMHPSAPVVQRQIGMGDVRAAEARQEAEARLPARFPDRGIRVIGSGSQQLARILGDCTARIVTIASDGILTVLQGPMLPGRQYSRAARATFDQIVSQDLGIIIDTNPTAPGATVGAFGMQTPGYQQIDVANVQTLAAASGARGLTACDAILHEMAEAAFARRALRRSPGLTGQPAFQPAHVEGMRVEDAIRSELGLPLRSRTDHGSLAQLGQEGNNLVFLETTVFGSGRDTHTQINVIRCRPLQTGTNPDGTPQITCDNEVVASTTVAQHVQFTTQAEALRVFNRYASNLGLVPIPAPARR
jgi:hypothetical protein